MWETTTTFSREDIHRNGTLAEESPRSEATAGGGRKGREDGGEGRSGRSIAGRSRVRLDIEKLQKKLVSMGAPPDQLVVVPSWCSWARSRGSAAKAPLVVRRAALKGQLHGLKGDVIEEYNTPPMPLLISTWADAGHGPAGLRAGAR